MTSTPSTPVTDARALFAAEQLPVPPVPAHLAAALAPCTAHVLATRPMSHGPYDLEHFLGELEGNRTIGEYAVVGFDGHGINSWAAHYYLVTDALALFVQLPWGGVYIDQDAARAEIAAMFEWSADLQASVAAARNAGRIPDGWRLAVAASRRGFAGWSWLSPQAEVPADWRDPAGMKAAILAEVANARPETFAPRGDSLPKASP